MLDKSKPYGEIFGDYPAKYTQGGKEYRVDGSPLIPEPVVETKKKPGRPRKSKDEEVKASPASKGWG